MTGPEASFTVGGNGSPTSNHHNNCSIYSVDDRVIYKHTAVKEREAVRNYRTVFVDREQLSGCTRGSTSFRDEEEDGERKMRLGGRLLVSVSEFEL